MTLNNTMVVKPRASLLRHWQNETHGIGLRYGICMRSWGSPSAPLSAIDLAELSWIAYGDDTKLGSLVNASFGSSCTLNWSSTYYSLPRALHVYCPPPEGSSGGTHVFAIKGTSTTDDAFADTSLFASVQVMQWLNNALPTLSVVPLHVTQTLLAGIDAPLSPNEDNLQLEQLDDLHQRIQNAIQSDEYVVITGHSLGGGIAQVLASRLEVPAVVFSAPGIVYSAARFDISLETAERDIVVVMPDGDLVPRVDRQAGQVQRIACRTKDGSQGSPASCHSLQRTTCELLRVCGDYAGRHFWHTCSNFTNKTLTLGGYFQKSPDGSILD